MNILYTHINDDLIQDCSISLSNTFAAFETMTKALNINPKELQPLAFSLLEHCIDHTYVAIDLEKNKIAGGLMCNDFISFLNSPASTTLSSKIEPIMSLLSKLENNFVKSRNNLIKDKEYLYHHVLFVDKEYSNKGIANNLYNVSQKNAQEKGFKNIVAILTGQVSQHLYLDKFGFEKLDEIVYEDFPFEGKQIFFNTEPKACVLAAKKIESIKSNDQVENI